MLNQGVSTQIDIIPQSRKASAEHPAPARDRDDSYKQALGRELRRGAPQEHPEDADVDGDQKAPRAVPEAKSQQARTPEGARTADETRTRPEHQPTTQLDGEVAVQNIVAPDIEIHDEDALPNVLALIDEGSISATDAIPNEPVEPVIDTSGISLDSADPSQDADFAPELVGEFQQFNVGQGQDTAETGSVDSAQLETPSLNHAPGVYANEGPPASLRIRTQTDANNGDANSLSASEVAVTVTDSVLAAPPQHLQLDGSVPKSGKEKVARVSSEQDKQLQGPESFFRAPGNQQGVGLANGAVSGVPSLLAGDSSSKGVASTEGGGDVTGLAKFGAVDTESASPKAVTPNPSVDQAQAAGLTSGQDDGGRTEAVGSPTGARTEPRVDQAQVVERVTQLVQSAQGAGRVLRARLHPPELGALQVEVRQGQTGAIARLTVETVAAQQVLNDHMQQLQESLSQSGPIERIEIHLVETQDSSDLQDQGHDGAGAFADQDGSFEDARRERGPRSERTDNDRKETEESPDVSHGDRSQNRIDLSELDVAV